MEDDYRLDPLYESERYRARLLARSALEESIADARAGASEAILEARLQALLDALRDRAAILQSEHGTIEQACRAGCPFCCHVQVAVSAPEVLLLIREIDGLAPGEDEGFHERIRSLADRTAFLDDDARARTRLPCAILRDRKCGLYRQRPLLCRAWVSGDRKACISNLREPDSAPVPFDPAWRWLTGAIARGLDDALWDVGLGETSVDLELTLALRIGFGEKSAFSRWLTGDGYFAIARMID